MNLRQIWDNLPIVTRNILAINIVVLLLCETVKTIFHFDLTWYFGMFNASYSAFHGGASFHIWQPFTYMFMHAGFWHLFCNMFTILFFGPTIEREWGEKKFLIYYIVCGVGAAIIQQLTWMLHPGLACTVGASGAVFGILFAFAWLFPEQKMFLLFIPIPLSSRVFVAIFALIELFSGVAPLAGDNVAHFAHLGGMLFGYLLIKYWQNQNNDENKGGRFKIYEGKDYSGYHYKDPVK